MKYRLVGRTHVNIKGTDIHYRIEKQRCWNMFFTVFKTWVPAEGTDIYLTREYAEDVLAMYQRQDRVGTSKWMPVIKH